MNHKYIDIQFLKDCLLVTSIPRTFILCISEHILKNYESSFGNYEIKVYSNVDYMKLRRFIINLKCKVEKEYRVRSMPSKIIEYLKSIKKNRDQNISIDLDLLPIKTKQVLYKYQLLGIKKCIENNGKLFHCDEMGLGKTIQTISTMSYFNKLENLKKILIVAPSFLRENWRNELLKWSDFEDKDIQVFYKTKQIVNNHNKIFIISYALLNLKINEFKNIKNEIDFVVIDESHYIKNSKSKRFKSIHSIVQNVKHLMLLTGTPIVNRPNELFSQLSILKPDVFVDYYDFTDRYCDGHKDYFSYNDVGSSCQLELNYILDSLMVRRLKQQVLSELPNKHRVTVYVESQNVSVLKQIKTNIGKIKKITLDLSQMNSKANNKEKYKFFERNKLISETVRLTASAKLNAAIEHLKHSVSSSEDKIIYFAYHQVMLQFLEDCCNKNNIEYIRIDGNTNQEIRQQMVDSFRNSNSTTRVALLSIKACSAGLNFTPVSRVVFTELTYEVATMLQAEDRINRIGALKTSTYEYLLCKDTLDNTIYNKIHQKFDNISNIVDRGENQYEFESKKLKV